MSLRNVLQISVYIWSVCSENGFLIDIQTVITVEEIYEHMSFLF